MISPLLSQKVLISPYCHMLCVHEDNKFMMEIVPHKLFSKVGAYIMPIPNIRIYNHAYNYEAIIHDQMA